MEAVLVLLLSLAPKLARPHLGQTGPAVRPAGQEQPRPAALPAGGVEAAGGLVARRDQPRPAHHCAPGLRPGDPAVDLTVLQGPGHQAALQSPVATLSKAPGWSEWAAPLVAPPLAVVGVAVGGPLSLLPLAAQPAHHLHLVLVLAAQALTARREPREDAAFHLVKSQGESGLGQQFSTHVALGCICSLIHH